MHLGDEGVWALETQDSASRYFRQQWSAEDGFRLGQISSITQTPDGYLWIGGENGLVSFDGQKFRAIKTPGQPTITHVLGLAVDGQGALWVWMQGASVLRQTSAGFANVTNELGFPDEITVFSSALRGHLLFATLGQQIFEYDGGQVSRIGLTKVSPALALVETPTGRVWVGTRDYGLAYIEKGNVVPLSETSGPRKVNFLLRHGGEALWVGTDEGLFLWNGSTLDRVPGPDKFSRAQIVSMVEDRDGHLWCGSDQGLFLVAENAAKQTIASGPLLSESISALFEDREGGLWIGAAGTVRRWKDFAFRALEAGHANSSKLDARLYADEQNAVWMASPRGGLYRLKQNGQAEECRPDVFRDDEIYSLSGREGDIWAGRRDGGLTHLHQSSKGISAKTFTTADGLAQNTVFSVFQSRAGTVWAGTLNSGLSKFQAGHWTTYTTRHGLPANTITNIGEDSQGGLWVGTPEGLASLANERWQTYGSSDGLPSGDISSILPDADSRGDPIVWVGTRKGLARFHSGRIQNVSSQSEVLQEPILGLTKDHAGNLWISTMDHLVRLNRDQLLNETAQPASLRIYGRGDGVDQPGGSSRIPSLVTDSAGNVWAATRGGIRVTNAAYMLHQSVATVVNVESIITDNGALDIRAPHTPALQRRIVFNFNGLNFDAPDRIQFRYRLDGYDKDWNESIDSRQAVYTNLDPATYRFRVIATNTEGQWNSREASISLVIEPALWQTSWFRSVCFVLCVLLAWGVYRIRMRQLAAHNHLVLEGRIAERMRIAQDLHDTLLQSFHALMLRFQAVSNMLPQRPSDAKELLDTAIDRAAEALAESRHAVQKMRAPLVESADLVEALTRLGDELRDAHSGVTLAPSFRVLLEGVPRTVNPLVRDDLYRIGREAIGNAFRHANARQVEVELRYEPGALTLRIRDDGVGMEPHLLARGSRQGHWGLSGMRERTRGLGGRFTVWSELRQGTEIEANIPGRVAYRVIEESTEDEAFGS
jgi:ligand-binding sensor domain-containing protein/signal transduction histidine kinase